jgi:hypothetical protein
MVAKRCIPTQFFKHPDIANLSKDSQLILIGLCLAGDDEGRGVADAKLLGREIDYPSEAIETALEELRGASLIVLYQVGRHRYYQFTEDWQKSMGSKRTPSKLPPPPQEPLSENDEVSVGNPAISDGKGEVSDRNSEDCAGNPAQYNLIESNLSEDEGHAPQGNVVVFPTPPSSPNDSDNSEGNKKTSLLQETASILRLKETDALARIVQEYQADPAISLLGEADSAREWIDDPRRNTKRRSMSVAFFRRWLKREKAQQATHREAAGTSPPGVSQAPSHQSARRSTGLASQSLMGLVAQYRPGAPVSNRESLSETERKEREHPP